MPLTFPSLPLNPNKGSGHLAQSVARVSKRAFNKVPVDKLWDWLLSPTWPMTCPHSLWHMHTLYDLEPCPYYYGLRHVHTPYDIWLHAYSLWPRTMSILLWPMTCPYSLWPMAMYILQESPQERLYLNTFPIFHIVACFRRGFPVIHWLSINL